MPGVFASPRVPPPPALKARSFGATTCLPCPINREASLSLGVGDSDLPMAPSSARRVRHALVARPATPVGQLTPPCPRPPQEFSPRLTGQVVVKRKSWPKAIRA